MPPQSQHDFSLLYEWVNDKMNEWMNNKINKMKNLWDRKEWRILTN